MPRGASVALVSLRILRRRTASNHDTAPDQSAVRQSSTGATSAKETTEIILPPCSLSTDHQLTHTSSVAD